MMGDICTHHGFNAGGFCLSPVSCSQALCHGDMEETQYFSEAVKRFDKAMRGAHPDLEAWWMRVSRDDFEAGAPKAKEYSAFDLVIMGQVLEHWTGAPDTGREQAIAFYILGKIARAVAAYMEGRSPSDDTWHDITYYSMMARRIRQVGGWPNADDAPKQGSGGGHGASPSDRDPTAG